MMLVYVPVFQLLIFNLSLDSVDSLLDWIVGDDGSLGRITMAYMFKVAGKVNLPDYLGLLERRKRRSREERAIRIEMEKEAAKVKAVEDAKAAKAEAARIAEEMRIAEEAAKVKAATEAEAARIAEEDREVDDWFTEEEQRELMMNREALEMLPDHVVRKLKVKYETSNGLLALCRALYDEEMKTVEAEGGKRRALTRLDKASNDEFRSLSESTKKSNVGATEFLEEKRDITQIASIFKIKEEVVRTTSSATTKTYSSRDSESIHDENMGADIESTSSFDDLQAALNDVSDDESTKEELAVGIKSSPSFEDFLKQLSEP